MEPESPYAWIWLLVILLLGLANAILLLLRSARLKKLFHPIILIAISIVFVSLAYISSPTMALIALPMAAVGTLFCIRMFKFCDCCGVTNRRHTVFDEMIYCRKCGAGL